MKAPALAIALALATGTVSFAQDNVSQMLMGLERQWAQAHKNHDAKAFDALLAPDFAMVNENGALQTKAEYIATALKQTVQSSDASDMKVQVHGNAAVVTGIASAKGLEAGKPFEFRVRFADTWVKMPDGKWQCVASAGVPVK